MNCAQSLREEYGPHLFFEFVMIVSSSTRAIDLGSIARQRATNPRLAQINDDSTECPEALAARRLWLIQLL
jgi:hypothetical protein